MIEVCKNTFLFLYHAYSSTLRKSSVKLKTKHNKLIAKKFFSAVFIMQFIKKQKLISEQTALKNNQKYKDDNYESVNELKINFYFLNSTDFYADIFKTVLNFLN